jgi:hypothetical protein
MARFYANENLPLPAVEELRRSSFEPDFVALAQRVHNATETQTDMTNQLVRIDRPGSS